MKNARFKYEYRSNASKLHKRVGELLRNSEFKHHKIYQEYPVNKINTSFPSGREKFDWYIKDLNIVIEVHGEQHYTPVCFGGITESEAQVNFERQQIRDSLKRYAAEDVGASYIIVKFDEEINEEILNNRIFSTKTNSISSPIEETTVTQESHRIIETNKDRRRKKMEFKKALSERRKVIRRAYKESQGYKDTKALAKQRRREAYQKTKELKRKFKGA